jgi:hypothetical protein
LPLLPSGSLGRKGNMGIPEKNIILLMHDDGHLVPCLEIRFRIEGPIDLGQFQEAFASTVQYFNRIKREVDIVRVSDFVLVLRARLENREPELKIPPLWLWPPMKTVLFDDQSGVVFADLKFC